MGSFPHVQVWVIHSTTLGFHLSELASRSIHFRVFSCLGICFALRIAPSLENCTENREALSISRHFTGKHGLARQFQGHFVGLKCNKV